ncbi:MAG: hypothetical protein K2X86_02655, partial [Cytophagaceae bacterium]|nr:hypothetical protein [Cytophagaceae bacterium]
LTRCADTFVSWTADEIIPYQNSQDTYNNFVDTGITDISLTPINGGTHGSSFMPMVKLVLPWFQELNSN